MAMLSFHLENRDVSTYRSDATVNLQVGEWHVYLRGVEATYAGQSLFLALLLRTLLDAQNMLWNDTQSG
jgi:hypothetical protein